jgi:hypothetical protein
VGGDTHALVRPWQAKASDQAVRLLPAALGRVKRDDQMFLGAVRGSLATSGDSSGRNPAVCWGPWKVGGATSLLLGAAEWWKGLLSSSPPSFSK